MQCDQPVDPLFDSKHQLNAKPSVVLVQEMTCWCLLDVLYFTCTNIQYGNKDKVPGMPPTTFVRDTGICTSRHGQPQIFRGGAMTARR